MDNVLRVAFIYGFLWAFFRVLGKRELARMTPFEFVTLLLIPQAFSRALAASPTVLVREGCLIDAHLNRERISPNQIFTAMHKVGIDRLASVRWAILEPDGQIAIIPNSSDARAALLTSPSH